MFLNLLTIQQDQNEFCFLLQQLTKAIDEEYSVLKKSSSTKENHEKAFELQQELFLYVAFLLIIAGERISLLTQGKNDFIFIRHFLTHKLFLIEPMDYANFIHSLYTDLCLVQDDQEIRLTQTKKFIKRISPKVIHPKALSNLFNYWSEKFYKFYQNALLNKPFPDKINTICSRISNKLFFIEEPAMHHRVLSCLTLATLQGILALRISQNLYPRDIQVARQNRALLMPLEQMLFDLQQIRNSIIHDKSIKPISIRAKLCQLVIVCSYLAEINDRFQHAAETSEFKSPVYSYELVQLSRKFKPVEPQESQLEIDVQSERTLEVAHNKKKHKKHGSVYYTVFFTAPKFDGLAQDEDAENSQTHKALKSQ